MTIGIANDHRGLILKQKLTKYLESLGYTIINYGSDSVESTDYPLYAFKVGEAIYHKKIDFGILICHTGIGMSIAANKVKGVRCAKVNTKEEALLSRQHNDANIISIDDTLETYEGIVKTFLETPFSNEERHIRRIEMIDHYDN